MKRLTTILALALLAAGCATREPGPSLERLDGGRVEIAELEREVGEIMAKAGVPGLSCAILNGSEVVYRRAFGVKDAATGEANDPETVFAAASFSKTVFAYLVMLFVEDGTIDLDRPLEEYLSRPIADDPHYADLAGSEYPARLTARRVLSHTTGFPNWRWLTDDQKLTFLFEPGTRFNYSGEGIQLLQTVVEEVTGRGLEELAQERVLGPLGTTRTSYVWQEAFESNHAVPHDEFERPRKLGRRSEADAAGSMFTTAGDYARFLEALLNASGRRKATVEAMWTPQITITSERMFGPRSWRDTDRNDDLRLAWSLGWGRFESEHGRAFFHTGHDFGWQNYTVTHADRGIGVVLMSNSDNFESVAPEIVEAAIGEDHSPFDWLGYEPFDPSRRREPPPEPVAVTVDEAILADYAGEYDLMGERRIVVKLDGGRLLISGDGENWDELFAESENRFFVEREDTRFSFVRDAAGEVTELLVHPGEGLEIPASRIR